MASDCISNMKITSRTRLQSRINSMIMMILILSLAGLLGWLSTLHSWQLDLTQSGRHTLSDASKQVLAKMDGPIEITAYAREDVGLRDAIKKITGKYQQIKPDIVLHFVNPDAVPDEIRNLGISVNGELVIRYQDRNQHVQSDSEEEFTNALHRLARGAEHWLAFIEGHGERSPLGQANFDLNVWVQQLANRGFKVQPLNLANIQAIPENTQVLVIAGPRVDYLPGETGLIHDYLEKGGNLLWLADPADSLHNLDTMAEQLRINIESGMIIDFAGQLIGLDDPTIVLQTSSLYPTHSITREFDYTTFFPTATSITYEKNDLWDSRPIISTGDHTWLETGKLEGEINFDENSDIAGPLDIGISLEREIETEQGENLIRKQQRIVVVGDGDFLSNTYVNNSGNLDLGIRIMNWLGEDDDFIAIPARLARDTRLEFSSFASVIIGFGFLIILPLALLATGLTIWWRRRKQ
jgi:ABC-type uncharacterized transport system involved in gliding motility auxiliary subunit